MPHKNSLSSISEDYLQSLHHYGPVTAVKLHKNYIIVGYGPILKVFDRDEHDELVFSRQVFKRNKIHDIAVNGRKLAVSGGRSFAILDFLGDRLPHERAINEWITAIEFLTEDKLLILTSHNEVLEVSTEGEEELQLLNRYNCNEKSILYSGSIRVLNESTVYVAAGTVMHGVLIWSLFDCRILHNLTDHEGSIFGVKIDPSGSYIISCSDDRSVKLYDFSGTLLASGWGHGSRIWALEFISASEDLIQIFSTGEDCTVRIWEYQGGVTLKQVRLYDHYHSGKHIWSGDVNVSEEPVFVTGGADGKVRAERLETGSGASLSNTFAASADLDFGQKESVKAFGVLHGSGFALVATNLGRILLHDFTTSNWTPIKVDHLSEKDLMAFTMIKSFEEFSCFVLCSGDGSILLIGFDNHRGQYDYYHQDDEPSVKKVINCIASVSSKGAHLLLNSPLPSDPMKLVSFSFDGDRLQFEKSVDLLKSDPKIFIPTSCFADPLNKWVLVGSRHANFAAYSMESGKVQQPLFMKKLCSGDTITSISLVQSESQRVVALVTLRDGIYMFVDIKESPSGVKCALILKNKITKSIEGGFMSNGRLYLFGFSSSHFSFWNESKQVEISKVSCGGGHRHWEVSVKGGVPQLVFSYMYRGKLFVDSAKSTWGASEGLLVEGTHGREIRDVAIQSLVEDDGKRLIATASEDSTVKVGKLDKEGSLEYFWTLNNHISGLQRVAFLNHEYLASSAANEELLIWKIDRLLNDNFAVIEAGRLQVAQDFPDLRIMDFASVEVSDGFYIACAYSNSVVKIFHYNSTDSVLTERAAIPYGSVCILNICFVTFGSEVFVMAGATDGNLTFWNVKVVLQEKGIEHYEPIIKQQLHQSGVKAIFSIQMSDGSYKIVTGGDDNSMTSSSLQFEDGELSLKTTAFVEQAASATITSISAGLSNTILVTSVDQIVRLWDTSDEALKCICATYTTVADTGCSDTTVFGDSNLGVVAGAGLSTFKW